MKTQLLFLSKIALSILGSLPIFAEQEGPLLQVDFESYQTGKYTDDKVDLEFGNHAFSQFHDRASIVEDEDTDHSKVLRIEYPKGGVGPSETGGQFLISLPKADEYWLSYRIKFAEGFDFRLGGKLPGLASGGGKYTGGNIPTEGQGWSSRYMWRRDGQGVIHFYYIDMPGKWGEYLPLSDFRFNPGQWHQLTQRVKVNSPDGRDGVLQVWVDGRKLLDRQDLRLRVGNQGQIDSFYFSTFHGGNSEEWGPLADSVAFFDDFVICTQPLIEQ